jgi:hypothetical protein
MAIMPERIHHAVHRWMLAALSRVSGRRFRGISFVLASSRSGRRFGGISFPCQKILALELLGRVLSPAPPRKMFAPRVADHNPVEWNVRQLTILIATLITFSAIARPHEHHFVPLATGLMPPVNVP